MKIDYLSIDNVYFPKMVHHCIFVNSILWFMCKGVLVPVSLLEKDDYYLQFSTLLSIPQIQLMWKKYYHVKSLIINIRIEN